jgi:hypothetical protein
MENSPGCDENANKAHVVIAGIVLVVLEQNGDADESI